MMTKDEKLQGVSDIALRLAPDDVRAAANENPVLELHRTDEYEEVWVAGQHLIAAMRITWFEDDAQGIDDAVGNLFAGEKLLSVYLEADARRD